MPKPKILAPAWEDISSIARYHLQKSGRHSAKAVTDALLDAIDLLENMPELGPLHHDAVLAAQGYRKLIVKRYVCVYRVIEGTATVYRVFHESSSYESQM